MKMSRLGLGDLALANTHGAFPIATLSACAQSNSSQTFGVAWICCADRGSERGGPATLATLTSFADLTYLYRLCTRPARAFGFASAVGPTARTTICLIAERQQVELQVQVPTAPLPTGTNLNCVAAICPGRQDHVRWTAVGLSS